MADPLVIQEARLIETTNPRKVVCYSELEPGGIVITNPYTPIPMTLALWNVQMTHEIQLMSTQIPLPSAISAGYLNTFSFLLSLGQCKEVIRFQGYVYSEADRRNLEIAVKSWYYYKTPSGSINPIHIVDDRGYTWTGIFGPLDITQEGETPGAYFYRVDFYVFDESITSIVDVIWCYKKIPLPDRNLGYTDAVDMDEHPEWFKNLYKFLGLSDVVEKFIPDQEIDIVLVEAATGIALIRGSTICEIYSTHTHTKFTPDYSADLPGQLETDYGLQLDNTGLVNPDWFNVLNPDIDRTHSEDAPYAADHDASVTAPFDRLATIIGCLDGAVLDIAGLLYDYTAEAITEYLVDQYYIAGDDVSASVGAAVWEGQTFTPSANIPLRAVKLRLQRRNATTSVTVAIRATDGVGHPTGANLIEVTINPSDSMDPINWIPTSGFAWHMFDFGAELALTSGTKYALIIYSPTASSFYWRRDDSSPTYAGGNREYSSNSGTTWSTATGSDYMFEIWYTDNDVEILPSAGLNVNDAFYFLYERPYDFLKVDVGVVATGTFVLEWEYYDGAWQSCVDLVDGTDGFRNFGPNEVWHTPQAGWTTVTVAGLTGYPIRARITDTGAGYSPPWATYIRAGFLYP
jgi:hypothetical protein